MSRLLKEGERGSVMAESGKQFVVFWNFTTGATKYRWRLRGENGETLAFSKESYTNKPDCESAVELARMEYPDAPVVDLTNPTQ